ncbi:MAG: hypothetical protein IJD60_11090 [Clostridia bacterium]|nr:hypothetical protein [Clostridia bacterium]
MQPSSYEFLRFQSFKKRALLSPALRVQMASGTYGPAFFHLYVQMFGGKIHGSKNRQIGIPLTAARAAVAANAVKRSRRHAVAQPPRLQRQRRMAAFSSMSIFPAVELTTSMFTTLSKENGLLIASHIPKENTTGKRKWLYRRTEKISLFSKVKQGHAAPSDMADFLCIVIISVLKRILL